MKRLTINPSSKLYYSEDFIKGFEYGTQRQLEADLADRPQGEWIDNGDRYFRCSLCGTKDTDRWCWCHGCGHPMKGADDERKDIQSTDE